jgi:hypothetical protein
MCIKIKLRQTDRAGYRDHFADAWRITRKGTVIMMRCLFISLLLLGFSLHPVQSEQRLEPTNYCQIPESWGEWDQHLALYPHDQTGVCKSCMRCALGFASRSTATS